MPAIQCRSWKECGSDYLHGAWARQFWRVPHDLGTPKELIWEIATNSYDFVSKEAAPWKSLEALCVRDETGTTRSASPTPYTPSQKNAVNGPWVPKGWVFVGRTGRSPCFMYYLYCIYLIYLIYMFYLIYAVCCIQCINLSDLPFIIYIVYFNRLIDRIYRTFLICFIFLSFPSSLSTQCILSMCSNLSLLSNMFLYSTFYPSFVFIVSVISILHFLSISSILSMDLSYVYDLSDLSNLSNVSRDGSIHTFSQWKFQDPEMEVLYHIRPYLMGVFRIPLDNSYLALT